jgi:hypothetical protein
MTKSKDCARRCFDRKKLNKFIIIQYVIYKSGWGDGAGRRRALELKSLKN